MSKVERVVVMEIDVVLKIASTIIVSLGGTGAIIVSLANFLANKIAMRLENKYQFKLDKELEQYKSNLEQRIYVTKTQFDIQLELYRNITNQIYHFLVVLYTTINEQDYPRKEEINPA